MEEKTASVAVIGGSGFYDIDGLKNVEEYEIETPFGDPSDIIVTGTLGNVSVAFLPRHGRGHRLLPSEVNSRANIWALKSLGVDRIISISAVGSMREEIHRGDFVVPDQLIDRTRHRQDTFFGDGLVAHIPFADPFCHALSRAVVNSALKLPVTVHSAGTYVCIEGPQFSTRAESHLYKSWNVDIIGMTAIPEAKLAREAEMCYSTVALVTDYDVWRDCEDVSADSVVKVVKENVKNVKSLLANLIPELAAPSECQCYKALDGAIMTQRDVINSDTKEKLAPILARVLED